MRHVRTPWLRIVMVMTALWSLGLATKPALAQPAPAAQRSPLDGKVIRDITIQGLQLLDEAYVRNQIRARAGQAYSADQVQRDVGRLLRTGRFLDVQADPRLVDDEVQLIFRLAEKPEVATLEFVGNQKFKDKDLRKELPFAPGDPLDLFDIRRGMDIIERLYREKGYAYVEVTYDTELLETERRVVYTVVENQRVRVDEVEFEGNVNYSDTELSTQVETKSYIWIFRTGDFDPDRAERDAAKVQQYYRERGFLDAEVSYITEFTDVARENMIVTFRINEGIRYVIREIRFRGNTVLTEDEIRAMMFLTEGDFLIEARLRNDVKKIETSYGSQGYIYARVVPTWVFAEEPGEVILTLTFNEGDQFTVGWIEVNGNDRTKEKCVRREVRLYPGELYDTTKTTDSEKRLKNTGLFSSATIEPIVPEDDPDRVRDMLVSVEENPQTNQFIAGVGASSDSGVVGNIVIENSNFDLFDTPRSFGEFIKGRSFRGAGQTFRIQLEPGTEITRFRIDFREPYLMDQPIGFGTSLYLFGRGRDGYMEERGGGVFSFDKAFEEGPLEGWVGEISLRSEYVRISDVDSFAARAIQDVEGGSFLTSMKFALLHDTTDSRFNPTRGHTFRVGYEQVGALGGEYYFGKITSSYAKHWTVAVDEEDRKSVITTHAKMGQIVGHAPVFERFYAGGIGSMRGFDFRGISPRDGIRKNRVGGDFMLLTGAEYSFPLYAKVMRGVFFADMGTVEKGMGISTWRAAVGAGVRLTLDIFGTVPMEFDFAIPISEDDDDNTRFFSFYIGLPFF